MKYRVVYADCPWQFRVWNRDTGSGRSAESHYPTMPLDELKRLNVSLLCEDDCCLFMWTTWPTLPEALELGKAWGFEYKTDAFLWAKTNKSAVERWVTVDEPANWFMGMGYWTRANTEPCLLFTRGNPRRKVKNVRQLIISAIRKHSQKPEDAYRRIEALVDGPYLELFARNKRDGWDSWGNEVVCDVQVPMLQQLTLETA